MADRRSRRSLRIAVVALAAALLLVACGGGASERPPSAAPFTATATATSTAAATATPAVSPTRPPTARPTSTPSPTPTATPTAPAAASRVVTNGDRSSGAVALTFDMGGRVEPAVEIVNWLIAHEVRATIFMTGAMADNVNTDAGREVLSLVQAHPELFALGNHSYSHPDFRTLSPAEIASELHRTENSIAKNVALDPRPWFRPPEGAYNDAVLAAVGAAGYAYTVMWDVDTIDWRPETEGGPTAADITAKVIANARGGSIVLMHLGGFHTLEALPDIVAGLRERGFSFRTVPGLFLGQ